MIGKVISPSSGFKGRIGYLFKKPDAKILEAEGVLEAKEMMNRCFLEQASNNERVKKPAGHISLSYSVNDAPILDDDKMVELAREYMQEMGIKNTQYIIVRHFDNANPHVHILYNRVDNEGKAISDSFERYRNGEVCKRLKEKHGLYFAKGKEKVKSHRLKGRDKAKYVVYEALTEILPKVKDWPGLQTELKKKDIGISFSYKGHTQQIQGICFTLGKIRLKASEVDRKFSYGKLKKILEENQLKENRAEGASESLYPSRLVIPSRNNSKVKPKSRRL